MIFRGIFEHALDAKHRLTVPAKFRAALAGGVVLAISPETEPGGPRAVAIWTVEGYEAFTAAALSGVGPLSAGGRKISRALMSNSHDTELDSAYRVMIPTTLMEYAGLDREVVVAGAGTCLEIWDRAAHAAYNASLIDSFPDIAASFDHTA